MNTPNKLHHKLIQLPCGRAPNNPVAERHEFVLFFDCEKSNPNGDPDTGNMPRVQPDSLKGLVTDVCLKRKIRNFFTLFNPHTEEPTLWQDSQDRNGYDVFIHENAILQEVMEAEDVNKKAEKIFKEYQDIKKGEWAEPSTSKGKKNEYVLRACRDALCAKFFDLRAFGGVVSTEGPLKGSFYGQIRGPIQFTFSESLDKVLPLNATITRCAVASKKEQEEVQKQAEESESGGNRTMGRKFGIDYGLYRSHIHFSPAFAAKTGFTYYDLNNFILALVHMFDDDHAAGRHLRLVGLVDFQHQSALGNAPAHKLFEKVSVKGKKVDRDGREVFKSSGSEFPRSLMDYQGTPPDEEYHVTKAGKVEPGKNGEGVAVIKVNRTIWEIPEMESAS